MARSKKNLSFPRLLRRLSHPRYRGKHIIAIAGKIFTASNGKAATDLLKKVQRKYPASTPTITYIPKADSLILILS